MTDPGYDPYEAYITDPPTPDADRPVDYDDEDRERT